MIRACSKFKRGHLLLQTKSKGTTITSSIAQKAYKGEYTHINVSTEQQTDTFKITQTNWITPANATIPRKGRKTSFITEQSYFFLAKNKKKQRMILTEDLNYRDHALTKDIVRKISRMYNLLHMIKNSEQEDPPQERSALILVWTNIRTTVANILNNKLQTTSILSDITCQDLCTLAECIKRTNLTINYQR